MGCLAPRLASGPTTTRQSSFKQTEQISLTGQKPACRYPLELVSEACCNEPAGLSAPGESNLPPLEKHDYVQNSTKNPEQSRGTGLLDLGRKTVPLPFVRGSEQQ